MQIKDLQPGFSGESLSSLDFIASRNCSNLPLEQWRCNEPCLEMQSHWTKGHELISLCPGLESVTEDESLMNHLTEGRPHLCWSHVDQTTGPKFPDAKSRNHKCRRTGRCTSFHPKSEPASHSADVIQKVIAQSSHFMKPLLNLAYLLIARSSSWFFIPRGKTTSKMKILVQTSIK